MKILMEEDRVHPDVIAKLWQIYSKSSFWKERESQFKTFPKLGATKKIPSAQRRGAIIVIGMLAVAKKSVLEDHVDTMLKVGLGKLGKVLVHRFFWGGVSSTQPYFHISSGGPRARKIHLHCTSAPQWKCEEGQRFAAG